MTLRVVSKQGIDDSFDGFRYQQAKIQSSLMQQLQYSRGEMTKQMLVELDSQAFISLSHSMAKALVI